MGKPFDVTELTHKIDVALDARNKQIQLVEQYKKNALNEAVAKNAMDQAYEMGVLFTYLQTCSDCADYSALGKAIIKVCNQFGLDAAVLLNSSHGAMYEGCSSTDIEAELLIKCFNSGKDIHLRNRSIVQAKNLTLLIKNMPSSNELIHGRTKDNLKMLINASALRLAHIDQDFSDKMDRYAAIQGLKNKAYGMKEKLSQHKESANAMFSELFFSIESRLIGLGLEEDQEKELLKLVDNCSIQMEGFSTDIEEIGNVFDDLISEVNRTL